MPGRTKRDLLEKIKSVQSEKRCVERENEWLKRALRGEFGKDAAETIATLQDKLAAMRQREERRLKI